MENIPHTIFLVHFFDGEDVPALVGIDIIVKFIPVRRGCKFGAWELCEWVEVKTVYGEANGVSDETSNGKTYLLCDAKIEGHGSFCFLSLTWRDSESADSGK